MNTSTRNHAVALLSKRLWIYTTTCDTTEELANREQQTEERQHDEDDLMDVIPARRCGRLMWSIPAFGARTVVQRQLLLCPIPSFTRIGRNVRTHRCAGFVTDGRMPQLDISSR